MINFSINIQIFFGRIHLIFLLDLKIVILHMQRKNAFLKKTSAYYDKQDYIEIMYRYNYFAYRDIDGLIKKSA